MTDLGQGEEREATVDGTYTEQDVLDIVRRTPWGKVVVTVKAGVIRLIRSEVTHKPSRN